MAIYADENYYNRNLKPKSPVGRLFEPPIIQNNFTKPTGENNITPPKASGLPSVFGNQFALDSDELDFNINLPGSNESRNQSGDRRGSGGNTGATRGGRPSNLDLTTMSVGELGSIFGQNIAGFSEKEFAEKYGMYLPQYNREREDIRRKQFGQQTGVARLSAGRTISDIFGAGREQAGKTGFAGSGAIESTVGRARRDVGRGFQSQIKGLGLGLESDVERFQADFASDVYASLADLAGMEAFTPGAYSGSKQTIIESTDLSGGDTKTTLDRLGVTQEEWDAMSEEEKQGYLRQDQDYI